MEVSRHLHQTAVYQSATRDGSGNAILDERGRPSYAPAKTINCRKRYKLTEILTPDAQVIRGEWIYRLDVPLRIDDILDNKRVQLVQAMVAPDGQIYGYKAVC